MGAVTAIEWAHHTFNPWTGCTKVSPGCDHCYAESWAKRSGTVEWGDHPRRRTSAANWRQPPKWNAAALAAGTRARVFCASLADVFDNQAPEEWRADLGRLIEATPALDWLLLTKRIGNAEKMLRAMFPGGMPANIWLGATVVDQEEANRDVPKLLATKAALGISIAFLSCEPLLGPIDLALDGLACLPCPNTADGLSMDPSTGAYECCPQCDFTGIGDEWGIDWVIVGGESGPKARPMHPAWARALRDQCTAAGVPFLFKQWGEWQPRRWWRDGGTHALNRYSGQSFQAIQSHPDSIERVGAGPEWQAFARSGKKAAGRLVDGVKHNGFPEARS